MVTSLGLILEPITATSTGIANFRNQLATIVPKEQEPRPTPVNVIPQNPVPFKTVAQNVTGLSEVLSFNPTTGFWFLRKYNDTQEDFPSFKPYFVDGGKDKDDEFLNGFMRVENITTGQTLIDTRFHQKEQVKYGEDKQTFQQYTDKVFQGLQTIKITVEAEGTTSGENGNQNDNRRGTYPYLLLKLINTDSFLEPGGPEYFINAFPNNVLSTTPAPIDLFQSVGGMGNTCGAFPIESQLKRTLVVYVPSNCLRYVIGGIRNNNNGPNTEGSLTAQIYFDGSNRLVYKQD
jgi:hypothetical protein